MNANERDQLRQMLLDRSMRFGEFVLSSGATSNYYIDVRKTSLHPEGLAMISKLFWEMLAGDDITAVGGLTLGADPLVAGLMLHSASKGKPLEGFLVRRTTKDHGTARPGRGQPRRPQARRHPRRRDHQRRERPDRRRSRRVVQGAGRARARRGRSRAGRAQIFQQRGLPFTSLFSIDELLPAEK